MQSSTLSISFFPLSSPLLLLVSLRTTHGRRAGRTVSISRIGNSNCCRSGSSGDGDVHVAVPIRIHQSGGGQWTRPLRPNLPFTQPWLLNHRQACGPWAGMTIARRPRMSRRFDRRSDSCEPELSPHDQFKIAVSYPWGSRRICIMMWKLKERENLKSSRESFAFFYLFIFSLSGSEEKGKKREGIQNIKHSGPRVPPTVAIWHRICAFLFPTRKNISHARRSFFSSTPTAVSAAAASAVSAAASRASEY